MSDRGLGHDGDVDVDDPFQAGQQLHDSVEVAPFGVPVAGRAVPVRCPWGDRAMSTMISMPSSLRYRAAGFPRENP